MRRCGTIISLTGCLCSSTYIKDTIKGPEQSSWVFNLNEANEELKSAFSQLTSREATEQKQNKKNMRANKKMSSRLIQCLNKHFSIEFSFSISTFKTDSIYRDVHFGK